MRIILVLVVLSFCGCKSVAIRDAKVYSAELDFVDAAVDEQVERGKALIAKECRCSEVMGTVGFETKECQELAETVLVIEARMRYHTAFMRYLGGISEERPAKEAPKVPDTGMLCPK